MTADEKMQSIMAALPDAELEVYVAEVNLRLAQAKLAVLLDEAEKNNKER